MHRGGQWQHDATAAEATAAGARVVAAPQRGYGRACAAGAAAADGDILVFMDGDGSDVPGEMGLLLQPILNGDYDFVIGSRMRGKREPGSMQVSQIFAGAAGVFSACPTAFPTPTWDLFAPSSARTLSRLRMREQTYGWNLEMQMRAAQCKLRIREVPVSCRKRAGGLSRLSGSLSGSLRAALRITETLLRLASTPKP